MEKWIHLMIQTEQDQEGYEEILSRYPPEKVIMFCPEHIMKSKKEKLNEKLESLIKKHEGIFVETIIPSISNEKYTNEITTGSFPFELLYNFINTIKLEFPDILDTPIEERKIVFCASSGARLYSSLLYSLSLVIGAEIITLDRQLLDGNFNSSLETQEWIKEGMTLVKNSKKELSLLLRNTLRHFLISIAKKSRYKSYSDPDSLYWLEAKDFTDSNHLPEASGHKTIGSGIEKGLIESDESQIKNEEKRYRLTSKGWMVALNLIRESFSNGLDYEIAKKKQSESEIKLSKIRINELQYFNTQKEDFFEGRIMPVKAFKTESNILNALPLSYNLPEVNKVITIFGRQHNDLEKGVFTLEQISDKFEQIDKKTKENFEVSCKEWNGNLKIRDAYAGELFISAKGNLESVFIESSKSIWNKMYTIMGDLGKNMTWSLDITQLDQQQTVITTLFSQLLGLPMTYVIRRKGKGERGLEVKKLNTAARFLVLNVPSFETVLLIEGGLKNKKLISLMAFYAWEEENKKQKNNNQVKSNLSFKEILEKKKAESRNSSVGVDYNTLREWFDNKIESEKIFYGVSEKMDKTPRWNKDLENLGMILCLDTVGKGKKKIFKISGLGKIIARWNLK